MGEKFGTMREMSFHQKTRLGREAPRRKPLQNQAEGWRLLLTISSYEGELLLEQSVHLATNTHYVKKHNVLVTINCQIQMSKESHLEF